MGLEEGVNGVTVYHSPTSHESSLKWLNFHYFNEPFHFKLNISGDYITLILIGHLRISGIVTTLYQIA